ncbi:fructosamine kinase [Trichophaea hybrida]|nr:fructosamine kinase [Trichophaea hybrida]
MKPDLAILTALNLPAGVTAAVAPHGSSGFTSTFKVTTGNGDNYFLKTGKGTSARTMFEGEYTSLHHLYTANPSITSKPISHGPLSSTPNTYYLLTSFLNLSLPPSQKLLAKNLATIHLSPIPPEFKQLGFGFPVPTCCGNTEQDNTWTPTWREFFITRRILPLLPAHDQELRSLAENLINRVIPRLLPDDAEIVPALVHGDLWAGNAVGGGRVIDPSCCYAHSEYELGIMKLFGGFDKGFWEEYCRFVPKDRGGLKEEEWEDRVELYALFHRLNHYRIFGGGYRDGAIRVMEKLIGRYGGNGG